MDATEFIDRCKKSPGVTDEQASVFRTLYWRMHVDSRKMDDDKSEEYASQFGDSSAVSAEEAAVPFQDRIRPGMVVSYNPTQPTGLKINLAMVMCPSWALETDVRDYRGAVMKRNQEEGTRSYVCSMVSPGMLQDSYSPSAWRQVVVDVKDMEAEVVLEYDAATRFYFMGI
jgi:kinesin family protein 2/24